MQQTFSLERCRKNQFSRSHDAWEACFFCFSCSMGVRFLLFATPLEREGDFFHFFNTSPARITKMKKIALRSHVVETSARKVQLQKSAANLRPAPASTLGTRFSTSQKNLQIDSIMSVIPPKYQWLRLPDAQQISYNFIQFHKKSSQNRKHYNDFNDFKYSVFLQIWCPVKMQIQVCGAWSTWFQDVVSLSNRAGSWVWVKQKALHKIFPPHKVGEATLTAIHPPIVKILPVAFG